MERKQETALNLLQPPMKVKRKTARKICGAQEKVFVYAEHARSCHINGAQEYLKPINLHGMINTVHEPKSLTMT
jgi:hypothetical protein